MAKAPKAPKASKSKDKEEVVEQPQKAENPAPAKQETAKEKKLTKVRNVSRNRLRQFSTGAIIAAGEEKDMIHESWLESQIEAGLLQKV